MVKRKQKAIGGKLAKAAKKAMSKKSLLTASGLTKKDNIKLDKLKKQFVKTEDELNILERESVDNSQVDKEIFLDERLRELQADIIMLEQGVSREEAEYIVAEMAYDKNQMLRAMNEPSRYELAQMRKDALPESDGFSVEDGPDPSGSEGFRADQRKYVENKATTAGVDAQERLAEKSYYDRIEKAPTVEGYYDANGEFVVEDDIPFSKGGRVMYAKGGKGIEALRKEAPEVVARMGYEEGGDVDAQMSMMMPPEQEQGMMPDEDMEDGYVDFIVSQSLSPEEETQLMNKLEADPELSVMFDKVLDKATEFAGSGPVEGPGSGVSDSIPARLSDGEFVLTAAATKQIGADRLQRMMEDAEMQAGAGRQQKQEGGEVEETKVDRFGKPVDKDIAEDEIKKGMMSTNPRLR